MTARVVIVGSGQAGAQVAISLRQLGFAGEVVLAGEESEPPYQRPPLSKAYMSGQMPLERTYIRSQAYYAKSAIDLRLRTRVARILPERRALLCADRELGYDRLVLCTGARARRLRLPGEDLEGVFYLRTLADSERIRAAARPGARAVIAGLTSGTRPGHVARAALEAIAWRVADVLSVVSQHCSLETLRVDGGLTRDSLLLRLQADAAGIPVQRGSVDATAAGSAALAAVGAGIWASTEEIGERIEAGESIPPEADDDWRRTEHARWREFVERAAEL